MSSDDTAGLLEVPGLSAAHRICAEHGAPVHNRGGGTSLSGETVNHAVVLDNSKYLTGIGELDTRERTVTCEPGVVNEQLNKHTGRYGLVFGPDPSSHSRCTIGGNIGNNSCGMHSVQSHLYGTGPRTYEIYAKLRELCDRYADDIRRGFPSVETMPRRVSGYNLDELLPGNGFNVARALTGTESTCVSVLRSTLELTPAMLERTLVVVRYPDIVAAAEHVPEIVERWRPIGLEALDDDLIESQLEQHMHVSDIAELPGEPPGAWLLVQFGADTAAESQDLADRFVWWLRRRKGYSADRIVVSRCVREGGHSEDIWAIREGGLGGTAFAHGEDNWPGGQGAAVPPERVGEYVRAYLDKLAEYGLRSRSGVAQYRAFLEDAADLVASFGSSLSGEHGDGQQRVELLEKQYGPRLVRAMREFKAVWDPQGKMNPGKVVDAYPLDSNLRLGSDYHPWQPETTLEEEHSTRGRARLLFEMLRGDVVTDGWQSKEVADSLKLCLACTGCTNDCPVNVDIPTYKAEFRSHHHRSWRRWRPRHTTRSGSSTRPRAWRRRFPGSPTPPRTCRACLGSRSSRAASTGGARSPRSLP